MNTGDPTVADHGSDSGVPSDQEGYVSAVSSHTSLEIEPDKSTVLLLEK